jgi:hypothetical protein
MKGTLQMYDELLAGGCTESQARVQANQLGEALDTFSKAINDFNKELTEIKGELKWMRIIGSAMVVAFLANLLFIGIKL